MAPLAIAMMASSSAVIILASVIALAVSLLSPLAGLVALAFMAPFPRPLEIPTPGLYFAMIGAIFLGLVLRLPIERPRLRLPSPSVLFIGGFLMYAATHFLGWLLVGPASARAASISSLFAVFTTGALTFVAASFVLRGRSPYAVLAALLLSATLASAIAVSQSFGVDELFGDLVGRSEIPNRFTGPFNDPNYFGTFLAAATTLGVACAILARSMRLKATIAGLTTLIVIALMLTLSRGALVALVAGLVTVAFTRGRRTGLMACAAVLLVVLLAWPMFAETRFGADSDFAASSLTAQLENPSRTGVWLAGVEVFQSSPLLGVGWGRLVEESASGLAAHNWYIAVLAEAGIVGLVLWALFLVSSVLALRTRPRTAQTVGYSVLATWVVASMFIEAPAVYGSAGLVLIVLAAAIVAEWGTRESGVPSPLGRAKVA